MKTLALGCFLMIATSSAAHAARSEVLNNSGSLTKGVSAQPTDEQERLRLLAAARKDKDIAGILAYGRPEEIGPDVDALYGKSPEGTAWQLPSGTNLAPYNGHIDVDISSKKQKLVMKFTKPDGSPGLITADVSGGSGIRSDLLKNHCFSVSKSSGDVKTVHGDTLVQPIFFRGKRGPGNSEIPNTFTYAIHGLLGEGYTKKLGTPASHGCIRVSREKATELRKALTSIGENAVICVK